MGPWGEGGTSDRAAGMSQLVSRRHVPWTTGPPHLPGSSFVTSVMLSVMLIGVPPLRAQLGLHGYKKHLPQAKQANCGFAFMLVPPLAALTPLNKAGTGGRAEPGLAAVLQVCLRETSSEWRTAATMLNEGAKAAVVLHRQTPMGQPGLH